MRIVLMSAVLFLCAVSVAPATADPSAAPVTNPASENATVEWTHTAPPSSWSVEKPFSSSGFGSTSAMGFDPNAKHDGEYVRYARSEPSGRESRILALHTTCVNCDLQKTAADDAARLTKIYRQVTTSAGPMCGYPAVRVIAQGLDPRYRSVAYSNLETTYFIVGDQRAEFRYLFGSSAPEDNLEAAYASLCPTAPSPRPAPSAT